MKTENIDQNLSNVRPESPSPSRRGAHKLSPASGACTANHPDRWRQITWISRRTPARAAARHKDPVSHWSLALQERRGGNRAAVALANKMARRLWATLRYEANALPAIP